MIVSVTGSGGKTTFIYKSARRLNKKQENKILVTTSTKILKPSDLTKNIFCDSKRIEKNEIINGIRAFVKPFDGEKCTGADADEFKKFDGLFDFVLSEDDGSKRLPLKARRKFEPVSINDAFFTVGVLPADLLGKNYLAGKIFNEKIFKEKYNPGKIFDRRLYANIVKDPAGIFKDAKNKAIRFSKVDKTDKEEIENRAEKIKDETSIPVFREIEKIRSHICKKYAP